MKTAYLINCHKDMQVVARLAHRIHSENSHIFIHVDVKVAKEEYEELHSATNDLKHCFISTVRLNGKLDDRSLVDINMLLVAFAKQIGQQNGDHYSYFTALSGQDYPIKPMRFIEQELERNYPDLYLDCSDTTSAAWISNKFNRNKALIQYRNWVLKCKISSIRKSLQFIGVVMRKILHLFGQTAEQRIIKKGWKIYGGSAWWILPDCTVDSIEKEYNSKSEFAVILLDESTTPEETFFQSLSVHILNPDYKETSNSKMRIMKNKTYVDFGLKSGRPITNHPYTITSESYDLLCSSDCWFARKFDYNIDSKILDTIDETILK